jgi:hypothetical protein
MATARLIPTTTVLPLNSSHGSPQGRRGRVASWRHRPATNRSVGGRIDTSNQKQAPHTVIQLHGGGETSKRYPARSGMDTEPGGTVEAVEVKGRILIHQKLSRLRSYGYGWGSGGKTRLLFHQP